MTSAPTLAAVDPPSGVIETQLERFNQKRRFTSQIQRLMQTDPLCRDVGQRMSHCAQRLGLRWLPEELEGSGLKLEAAHLCRARLCPFCEWRRTKAWRRRLIQGLGRFHAEHPTHKAIFLTLTVRNCELSDLREQIAELHRGFSRMVKCDFWPTPYYFRRTEVTISRLDLAGNRVPTLPPNTQTPVLGAPAASLGPGRLMAHPHLHVLLLVPASYFGKRYVKQLEWQRQWQMACRLDYAPVVDIRRASAKGGSDDPEDVDVAASCEAAKYAAKATDLLKLGSALPVLHEQIKGVRLVGVSKRLQPYVSAADPTPDEMTDASQIAASGGLGLQVVAQWDELGGAYQFEI